MNAWNLQRVDLKFGLGDRVVWRRPLRLQVRSHGLLDGAAPAESVQPPPEPLPGGSDGFLVRDLAVAREQPPVSVRGGFLCYVVQQYRHYYIDLAGDFKGYKAKFSAKTRSTLGRKVRRFAEHCGGRIVWRAYSRPQEMADFYRAARTVSARSYQERLLDAGLPQGESFLDELVERARADQVRGYVLFDGERPVSYLYCPAQRGVLLYAHLGYDPDYLKLSVGTVLGWLALEDIFREGRFRFFDFTEGESEHKRLFATHDVLSANVMFLRSSLANRLLVRAHLTLERLGRSAGQWLERRGMKARVRRLMRFGGATLRQT